VYTTEGEVQKLSLFPILMCAHGDSPWGAKLACACGHAAINGCWRCGIQGTQEAPDGTKLSSTAFGSCFEAGPCRTYDISSGEWTNEKVCFAKEAVRGRFTLDRKLAARLKTSDELYTARGHTAVDISEDEQSKAYVQAAAAASQSSSMAATASDAKQYQTTYNAANRRHLRLGASGECVFSCLPYFRCAHPM
jgi:hypothetical protein